MIIAGPAVNTATIETTPDLLGALIGDPEDRLLTVSNRIGRLRSLIAMLAEGPEFEARAVNDVMWSLWESLEAIEAIAVGTICATPVSSVREMAA